MTKLYPHTKIYAEAARKLDYQIEYIKPPNLIKINNQSGKFTYIYKSKTEINNSVSIVLCKYKHITHRLLKQHHIPVTEHQLCNSIQEVKSLAHKWGFPLVTKPYNGTHGIDVTVDINDIDTLNRAYHDTLKSSPKVLIEKFFTGTDHRILVLDHKIIAIVKREPPFITGNGTSTIRQLSNEVHRFKYSPKTTQLLAQQGYHPNDILPPKTTVLLRKNCNASTGGIATTITNPNYLHPTINKLVGTVTQILNIRLACLDILIKDPQKEVSSKNIRIVEVNSNPGMLIHYKPTHGPIQPVATTILRRIFDDTNPSSDTAVRSPNLARDH